tara:strand:+ start:393 stop:569 length:177 start_codon:yes stop_codon:yes gene_type:complete
MKSNIMKSTDWLIIVGKPAISAGNLQRKFASDGVIEKHRTPKKIKRITLFINKGFFLK